MPTGLYGKNKQVRIKFVITVAFDKSDSSFTGYTNTTDRDEVVKGLENGEAWGIESVELTDDPPKDSLVASKVKVKAIKLPNYPKTTKGHQHDGVYKYYVDTSAGAKSRYRLWLENFKTELKTQEGGKVPDKTTKIHELKVEVKITAKLKITLGH